MKKFLHNFIHLQPKWVMIILALILLGAFFFLMTVNNVYTETYNIERFSDAKETIRSPITIENKQETKRKTRETVQAVEDRYNISTEITKERLSYIGEIFDAIAKVEKDTSVNGIENSDSLVSSQEKVQQLKQILSPEITDKLDDGLFYKLLDIKASKRQEGKKLLLSSLENVLKDGVRTENIQRAESDVTQSIKYSSLDKRLKEPLKKLSKFAIVENSFFDVEKTMEARKEAASNVEPVVIRAGEIIVREGQTITDGIYEELKLIGLLNQERNVFPVIGLVLLILLIITVIGSEINHLYRENQMDNRKIAAVLMISFIVIVLMKVVSLFTTTENLLFFAVPVATGGLLIKQLIQERFAIVLSILYAILGSVIFNGELPGTLNIEAGIYFFFSQMAGIIFLVNVKDRLAVIKAGAGMAVINVITVLLFLFLSFEKYSYADLIIQSAYGVSAALLSAVLTIGLLPFFETGLGILSDIKLLSLASPNQPLLRKILTEAPGTYHHSVMVANLSETACEAIGANGLLARVGAYYHDIGKTIRPHYFIENQVSIKNPHDLIEPLQSAEIIISHPYDGAEMLKEHKMPEEIIDIAKQHHGTTLLQYFYQMEKKVNEEVKEELFRYPGPKPQTKEAAVISICDSVEAAVRSLKEPTKEKIDEIVGSIVNSRLMDGQLNECDLTLSELDTVHQTICETLKGIFHSRIKYPTKEAT
ncbi:HD family phosphohydrolase [Virgibacillus siamensis]|uniref:HD family phosphohydrolase n=1 Tax=Virgibacillus siamensis TaxID=480071 RepID=UPI0009849C44|nr:HDIG domain-containing metalloprotein [Virgibacillus siamensis]